MENDNQSNITFFGTGTSQGIPMIGCQCAVCTSSDFRDKRLRSSALIQHNGLSVLIDAGPDFRYQMLRSKTNHLDAILLTHEHKDHTGGLDDIRALNYFNKKPFPIYCEERVLESLKNEFAYAFEENPYPGVPQFNVQIIKNAPFKIKSAINETNDCTIIPIRAFHYKLPVLGFRIGDIAYITDASQIPVNEFEKLKNLSVMVVNTVRREKHISHFSLSEALEVIDKVGAKRSYLTHLSHQIGLHTDLQSVLPKKVYAAYDGLTVTID